MIFGDSYEPLPPMWFRVIALLLSGGVITGLTMAVIRIRNAKSKVKISEGEADTARQVAMNEIHSAQETVAIRELRRLNSDLSGHVTRIELKVEAKDKEIRDLRNEYDKKFDKVYEELRLCHSEKSSLKTEVEYLKKKDAARDSKHDG